MDLTQRIAYFLILILSVGLGLWKGGAPERTGALVFVAMALVQAAVMSVIPSHFVKVDPDSLMTDLIGFLGFGYLALEARRFWPIWATSLQILSLSAHFVRWADIGIHPLVYAVMRGGPTFGAAIAILIGTLSHWRRLHRHGFDASWQTWSRHAAR
ncbi:hypothetical protein [Novosphingobium album (ex Hu et al. 2023)]|uniref:Uncharacterized protein n=1 Tax=Novosphingobium album (ex Hu et al. 2023) TaxID=2930093 RepID=A0ABT0AZA4_9SPHN|nr:hypothetical protein [Novosphingobium album (ex Hu et al. 2023)]MCJ2178118.1 hypothetical protein [Novosphingobium album (ex Hu et al. 2023)]